MTIYAGSLMIPDISRKEPLFELNFCTHLSIPMNINETNGHEYWWGFSVVTVMICQEHPTRQGCFVWGLYLFPWRPSLNTLHAEYCWQKLTFICIFYHFSTQKHHRNFRFFLKLVKNNLILCIQYHACWWPGDSWSQGISRHGIDKDCKE